jgi:molecular chaperone Hsp33
MIEDTISHAPHITGVISEGATAENLVNLALGEIAFEILEEKDIEFRCNCSFERAVSLISSLGRDEVASMLTEDKGAKMTCGFCNEVYTLNESDLRQMLDSETI